MANHLTPPSADAATVRCSAYELVEDDVYGETVEFGDLAPDALLQGRDDLEMYD